MNRLKKYSDDIFKEYRSKFSSNFADNKKALNTLSIIRSKGLKNELAGYITKIIKREQDDEKRKQDLELKLSTEVVKDTEPEDVDKGLVIDDGTITSEKPMATTRYQDRHTTDYNSKPSTPESTSTESTTESTSTEPSTPESTSTESTTESTSTEPSTPESTSTDSSTSV